MFHKEFMCLSYLLLSGQFGKKLERRKKLSHRDILNGPLKKRGAALKKEGVC